jgi:hypothetical protein
LSVTDKAGDLIAWARSKKIVLALLRQNQIEAKAQVITVLRAVITRWTCHFCSYERLIKIQVHLRAISYQDDARSNSEKKIIQGDAKAKAKASKMCDLIKSSVFWVSLVR